MTREGQVVLKQCEEMNALNLPYKPGERFSLATQQVLADGYLEKGNTGGFWITAAGKRERVAEEARRTAKRAA